MIRFELKNRRALITGGACGIGLETARMLAEAGADVGINFLPGDRAAPRDLRARHPTQALSHPGRRRRDDPVPGLRRCHDHRADPGRGRRYLYLTHSTVHL